ncbi:hypothetical protein NHX12_000127 [Muraenolepis orangiensis]|uniref:Uncharacterized protein n=1 Tax=Muraenolepis orangiensis TaxID=630683 RepID=A0A9Q0I438_9TELE|nr:hypothetical protein NHX12_000127 [Muraenolepis orangiensis]
MKYFLEAEYISEVEAAQTSYKLEKHKPHKHCFKLLADRVTRQTPEVRVTRQTPEVPEVRDPLSKDTEPHNIKTCVEKTPSVHLSCISMSGPTWMVTMRGRGWRVLAPPSMAMPSVAALLGTLTSWDVGSNRPGYGKRERTHRE